MPFFGRKAPQSPAPLATEPPPETIGQLSARLDGVESQLATLRLEWTETLDKITAWANRQAQRDRAALKRQLAEQDQDSEPELQLGPDAAATTAAQRKAQLRRNVFSRGA